jgi:recombinational DNA repair ATPase RecF
MKVLELHIENIRGVKESIDLKPNGKNFVIYGPNGTGKSAVVDALEFLFTGKISRLSGEGTLGISLSKHGCHIDAQPKDAVVQASIEIPGCKDLFELKRSMTSPNHLKILKGNENKISDVLKIAINGHHVLARRNILKFVAAQKGERSKEIQELLNLDRIERLRQTLVSVETDTTRNYESSAAQYISSRDDICHYLSIVPDQYSEKLVIDKINGLRGKLKGTSISVLEEDTVKKDLNPPSVTIKGNVVEPTFIKSNIEEILRITSQDAVSIRKSVEGLVSNLKRLITDETVKRELQSHRLLELGISLLDASGKCPLCEKKWEPKELRDKLEKRLLSAKEAKKLEKDIEEKLEEIKPKYISLKNSIEHIGKSLSLLSLSDMLPMFQKWFKDVDAFQKTLANTDIELEEIKKVLKNHILFVPRDLDKMLEIVSKKAETEGKKLTEEQKAWDTLTRLEPLIRGYQKNKKAFIKATVVSKGAALLKANYETSKDKILNELYDKIKNDFVEYYKFMHGPDEEKFDAEFKARGAELIFEVDFYGRGKFPPLALHSEGHQDSMGLCLYLALMKLLSEGKVLLTILDDVVMSIDSNHRRAFSQLLLKYFPDRQFLITTHNTTWARQLQTDGVVQSKNMIEFQNWSVNTGPIFEMDADVWKKINDFIEKNNISSAAHALREHLEFFSGQVCEKIGARVIYKTDSRHELGDLLPAAIEQYKDLLKRAKRVANSWDNKKQIDDLNEKESIASEIIARSQVEQWGINENVHYSKWADFTKEDFQPIADAFSDLCGIFRCSKCGSLIHVTTVNKEKKNLRCSCEDINWNLEEKKKS